MLQVLGFCSDSARIWQLIGQVVNIFKIAIPILIVVLATIDLGKAVMAGEEKEIQAAQKMLIKRLIYGVLVFFVTTIVQVVFNLIGESMTDDADQAICWTCVARPGDCDTSSAFK